MTTPLGRHRHRRGGFSRPPLFPFHGLFIVHEPFKGANSAVYRRDLLNLLNDPGVIGQKDSLFSTLRPDFVKALVFIQEVTGLTQLNYFPQGVQRGASLLNYFPQGVQRGASLLVGEVGVSPKIPHEGGRVGKTAFA